MTQRLASLRISPALHRAAATMAAIVLLSAHAQEGRGSDVHVARLVYEFTQARSSPSWTSLTKTVDAPDVGPKGQVIRRVVDFSAAVLQRDLPNSMSRDNVDQYVDQQIARAQSDLEYIKAHPCDEVWTVIRAMILQQFEHSLMWGAVELAARLSSDHFEKLAAELSSVSPDTARTFEVARARWLARDRPP